MASIPDKKSIAIFVVIWVIIAVHAIVFAILFSIFLSNPQWRLDIVNIAVNGTAAVISSILTVILISLYYRMSEITNDQKKIAERQVRLEELQNKPYLFIEDVEYSGDQISLKITNEGAGLAKDLSLRCDASLKAGGNVRSDRQPHIEDYFKEEVHNFEISTHEVDMYRIDTSGDIDEVDDEEKRKRSIAGNEILRPRNTAWYQHRVDIGWMSSRPQTLLSALAGSPGSMASVSFSETMTTLHNEGIKEISIQITLIFSDVTDKFDAISIESGHFEVDENLSLEEAVSQLSGAYHINKDSILDDIDEESLTKRY